MPSDICAKLRTVAASNNRDHALQSLLLNASSRHASIFLFFAHIPFVVNHTINATPPERLQQNHVFGVTKKGLSCKRWTPFFEVKHAWAPFLPKFSPRFCSDFPQINTFGGALASPATPPPSPLCSKRKSHSQTNETGMNSLFLRLTEHVKLGILPEHKPVTWQ